jgi:hypothetical protein
LPRRNPEFSSTCKQRLIRSASERVVGKGVVQNLLILGDNRRAEIAGP